MDADFNTPVALSVLFDLAREINTLRSRAAIAGEADTSRPLRGDDYEAPPSREDINTRRRTLVRLLDVLGIDIRSPASTAPESEPFINLLLDVRRELRSLKLYANADSIRDRLKSLGVAVEDQPDGTSTWRLER